jgi:nucleoside-diphosphate-sugar epimerase
MRVFVTGASGFVGSAVVQDLIAAGHKVLGLARSDAAAKSIATAGADVHRGSVEDLDSLKSGAAAADGVIHTAFIHDFTKFKESCETDRRAIGALGDALVGSNKPLVVTSGTALLASAGGRATEDLRPASPIPRVASEQAADAAAKRGVHVSVVRLPPTVHGAGDHGFVPILINLARDKGAAAYVGDGQNRWPAVHRSDAARVYRLAVEKAAADARYHAVAEEEGIAFRDIATAIGRHLNVPVVGKSGDEAAAHFGWFAHFATLHNPASSRHTRTVLGWQPNGPELIADMDAHYFVARAA